ncbi:hypothetical protein [Streptomyces sp. NPDC050263]|uniref:hypothetical protein n=1 Tax=Streptomyces sp. NPDC050263 TaxID=3155037 RepID=UPI00342E885B
MRDHRQTGDNRHSSARERSPLATRAPWTAGRGSGPNPLLGLQQSAGNAATVAALNGAGPSTAGRRNPPMLDAIAEVDDSPLELPPYLRHMEAGGLSTAYALTGHEFVTTTLAEQIGRRDDVVAEIGAELAGRPESFYGRGRAFAVTGPRGTDRYDVSSSRCWCSSRSTCGWWRGWPTGCRDGDRRPCRTSPCPNRSSSACPPPRCAACWPTRRTPDACGTRTAV